MLPGLADSRLPKNGGSVPALGEFVHGFDYSLVRAGVPEEDAGRLLSPVCGQPCPGEVGQGPASACRGPPLAL